MMSGSPRRLPRLTNLPAWWGERLFPGAPDAVRQFAPQFGPLLLAVVAGTLFFTRLTCPLLEPEEARYAEIPRQMLAEGRFVEPVWHGQPYYHKPPLLYWLVMACYALFGVHDWAARLVPALASVGTIFVSYAWGRRALGERAGLFAALVLALSARFVYLGRMLTFDPLLTLWVTAALAAGHRALADGTLHRRWWLASAVCCGLGVLTKGPVAAVLVLAPLGCWLWLERRAARPTVASVAVYLTAVLAVAAPWFAAMAVLNPAAAGDFFWLHHVQRYLEPVDHEEPVWFFLPGLLLGSLPWSLLLIPLVGGLWRRSLPVARRRPAALGFALLALAWCLMFFSLSGCKRAGYILPALPQLALCLGYSLSETVRGWQFVRRQPLKLARAALVLALTLGIGGSLAAAVSGLWTWACGLAAAGALATVSWPMARWLWRQPPGCLWGATAAVTFLILAVGVQALLPSYHRRFSLRGSIRRHAEADGFVLCYPKRWDSVTFYLDRASVPVFTADQHAELQGRLRGEGAALAFVKTRYLEDFRSALPAGWDCEIVGRQGPTVTSVLLRRRSGAEVALRCDN
jgi:4-amino-4-deoxy-L-arabinose transferase-like glycosyltransferase